MAANSACSAVSAFAAHMCVKFYDGTEGLNIMMCRRRRVMCVSPSKCCGQVNVSYMPAFEGNGKRAPLLRYSPMYVPMCLNA